MHSPPDDTRRLAARLSLLASDPAWQPWPEPVVLATVASTMSELRDRAVAGAPEGTTIVADEQTAGRGRHGRTWQSPPGTGVWASVLVRPGEIPPSSLGVLPLLIGSRIAGDLSRWSGAQLRVKWPNDIVWVPAETESDSPADSSRPLPIPAKLAGILAERLTDGAIVIGVGLNVLAAPTGPEAGALADLVVDPASHEVTREDAAVVVLRAVAQATRAWLRGERDLDEYRGRCVTLGRRVTVTAIAGADAWEGLAVGVDETGLLLVDDGSGMTTAVSAGDVTLAR